MQHHDNMGGAVGALIDGGLRLDDEEALTIGRDIVGTTNPKIEVTGRVERFESSTPNSGIPVACIRTVVPINASEF